MTKRNTLRWVVRLGDGRTPGMLNFNDVPGWAEHMSRLASMGPSLRGDRDKTQEAIDAEGS